VCAVQAIGLVGALIKGTHIAIFAIEGVEGVLFICACRDDTVIGDLVVWVVGIFDHRERSAIAISGAVGQFTSLDGLVPFVGAADPFDTGVDSAGCFIVTRIGVCTGAFLVAYVNRTGVSVIAFGGVGTGCITGCTGID